MFRAVHTDWPGTITSQNTELVPFYQHQSGAHDLLPHLPLIAESESYAGSFTLTNHHDVAVKITEIQSSCQCDAIDV